MTLLRLIKKANIQNIKSATINPKMAERDLVKRRAAKSKILKKYKKILLIFWESSILYKISGIRAINQVASQFGCPRVEKTLF